jgi:2,4-diketo-3-deoxy-L-fuconate hydrolase
MKLLRYGAPGAERPGAVDARGVLRDLGGVLPDLTPEWLAPARLAQLAALDLSALPPVSADVRIGVPVSGIRQFMAIGLNYHDHAAESGMPAPAEPVVFTKAITSLAGPDDDVTLPPGSVAGDWEVELAVVIGTLVRRVTEAQALSHVAGYCLANDVSERDWQLRRGGQWCKGKSFDGFGPLGPWLVTADELPDPQGIALSLSINGESRQNGNTRDMIFTVAQIVSHLSEFMTLLPGDVITTGTPAGVGMGMKPPVFLKRGDVMSLEGGPLGRQRQRVL